MNINLFAYLLFCFNFHFPCLATSGFDISINNDALTCFAWFFYWTFSDLHTAIDDIANFCLHMHNSLSVFYDFIWFCSFVILTKTLGSVLLRDREICSSFMFSQHRHDHNSVLHLWLMCALSFASAVVILILDNCTQCDALMEFGGPTPGT